MSAVIQLPSRAHGNGALVVQIGASLLNVENAAKRAEFIGRMIEAGAGVYSLPDLYEAIEEVKRQAAKLTKWQGQWF